MNHHCLASLLGAALLFFTLSVAHAEEPVEPAPEHVAESEETSEDKAAANDFGAAHRRRLYEASRLDGRRAVLYSLALPGVGNFYAGQPAIGTVALVSMVFTGMFIAFGLRNNHPDLVRIGIFTGTATYTGAAITSYLGVRTYNDRLRRSLHVDDPRTRAEFSPSPGPFIGWSWSF